MGVPPVVIHFTRIFSTNQPAIGIPPFTSIYGNHHMGNNINGPVGDDSRVWVLLCCSEGSIMENPDPEGAGLWIVDRDSSAGVLRKGGRSGGRFCRFMQFYWSK